MTAEAFIYDAVRTPRGRGKKTGALHSVKPISLTTGMIDAVGQRNPQLDCYGVQRIHLLSDVLVMAGAGVGDGSLNYANTARSADWSCSIHRVRCR